MPSLFADTHNVVAILEKSDASEGFPEIIDFLSGIYIYYALMVSPHIYILCIKQFWNTAVVKRWGAITSQWKFLIHTILQSLSAKRTSWNEFSTAMASAVICHSKGQRFNFSMYIFDSLVRNVDSSSKFYMYPHFIQLIIQDQVGDLSSHTIRYISPALTQKVFANMRRVGKGFSRVEAPLFETMLEVREVDAEEEVQVPAQDDVDQENVSEEIADDVAQPTSPLPPSPVIPFSPPHQSPRPPQPQATEGSSLLVQQVLDKCSALVLRVEGLETANTAQQLEILKLKARVKKLERLNKVKSSKLRRLKKVGTSQRIESSEDLENVVNQERMNVDIDEGIELVVDQDKDAEIKGRQADTQAEIYNIDLDHSFKVLSTQEHDAEVQEAVEIVTTAKLMTKVVTAAATQIVAASNPKPAAKPKVLKIAYAALAVSTRKRRGVVIRDPEEELHDDTSAETLSVKDKGKGILVEDPKPMKKKDQTEIDAEYARKFQEELDKENEESFKKIDWNAAFDHVQAKDVQAKGTLYIKRYHGFKKKPQSESEVRKNMIAYLKNTEVFKMAFFTGKTYDQILPIFQARLCEQAKEDEDLKKQLEVVVDEDDDVFIEATPIGRKVPVVNYEIVMINNKPSIKSYSSLVISHRVKGVIVQRIELVVDQDKDAEIEGRQVDTQAEIYNIDLDHSSKVLSMQEDDAEVTPISAAKPAAKPKVLKIIHAAPAVSTRKREGVVIRDPEEELHDDTPAETLSVKDKGKEEEIIKSINETPAQKATKRTRLHEHAKEDENLKKQLEVVVDEDDDVFIKATLIGIKVPVVNYEIVMINNKPRYKIIRADDTHQLYTSFITFLKNFDREDLEDLWKIMKARVSTSKPTNFFDDYLLVTLKTMFEKTDAQDVIWRSQQTEHGQALVKT
uniref:Synaptobrevin, longin-like domain protein n=1 Tax=Tanacetum cinerariifolium TaxID=118510 RepID=A0A6L2J897_TANCI|nr:hypothetical protein [Tanacetum cinerariifolium]